MRDNFVLGYIELTVLMSLATRGRPKVGPTENIVRYPLFNMRACDVRNAGPIPKNHMNSWKWPSATWPAQADQGGPITPLPSPKYGIFSVFGIGPMHALYGPSALLPVGERLYRHDGATTFPLPLCFYCKTIKTLSIVPGLATRICSRQVIHHGRERKRNCQGAR